MKKKSNYLGIILLGMTIGLINPHIINAQSETRGHLMSVTEFVIKPGHEMQFQEGIKAWKSCYMENNGNWTWRIWERQQGEGSVYVLASEMANWAEMDRTDESAKKCRDLARSLINPHVEKATSHVTRFLPDMSKTPGNTSEVIWVSFYKMNPGYQQIMMEVVKEVEAIRKNANMPLMGFWYQWQTGDPESPDYHFVIPYNNYAAIDSEMESVWMTVEKQAGKSKRDELQSTFRSALGDSWSYIYKLNKDISRISN